MATTSPLWTQFFSQENINFLQESIIANVLMKANVRIPYQSQNELVLLMTDVFYSTYVDPYRNVDAQIQMMADVVIQRAYRFIEPQLILNKYYNENKDRIPMPLPNPMNMSARGLKTDIINNTTSYIPR
jgi:hypothetical protein